MAASARAHMKDPAHRTKVVLRRLPPTIAQQAVMDQVDARFAGRYDWACFRPGNASQKNHRFSRLYLNFNRAEDVFEFAEVFNGHVFVNEKGAQFKAIVEYAPSQQVPKSNIKKDGREGTIMKDPEYLEFLEHVSKPTEHLPSAEIQLERKEAERAAAGKEAPVMTPLMIYVRQQRAAKSMAQRSGGRLSRKNAGVATSSSSPLKRSSEKRRSSMSTQYVVRDSAKEKPTYILMSKREVHTPREKVNAGASDATRGGVSGSAQAIEGKRDKFVLLKGRARVNANTSDTTTQQQSLTTPIKNAPSSSRQDQRPEAIGGVIKTILSNKEVHNANSFQHEQEGQMLYDEKDKQPPRVPNSRSIVKDRMIENAERSQFEKPNHLHNSVPSGEKIERHTRNRDRPDRGVWAPRRYDKVASGGGSHASSSESSLSHSHPVDNLSQFKDGHCERKTDPRSRGGSVENGHRHANRRGPPRGLKETEIYAGASDGNTSKRGTASYGTHERQVWVQKSSSGS